MYSYVIMTSGLIKKSLQVTFFLERSTFVLEKGDLEKLKPDRYYSFYYLLLRECIFSVFAGKAAPADAVIA